MMEPRPTPSPAGSFAPSLRFRPDGTFTIAQFTDLHWRNGEEADQQTRALMERILDIERPDLAALTGDIIAGRPCADPARSWQQAVAPLEERSVPWAAVFGNHDDEGGMGRAEQMAVQRICRMCLSDPGPDHVTGVGNYLLTIGSAETNALAAALYFMDSRSYAPKDLGGYGWFERDQIAWYLETARSLAEAYAAALPPAGTGSAVEVAHQPVNARRPRIPALAFFHIPLPEYNDAWDFQTCRGSKYEDICCPRINTGLFAALYEAGDVRGTFVGHDHVNDFEGTVHGIRLAYGRWGGYSTYGAERLLPGARIIRLMEGERAFTMWIRQADGSVADLPEHPPQCQRTFSEDGRI